MKAKWYFSALIVVLALFGVNQFQISLPNQEIVLQFTDIEVTSDEAQNAVANVKQQLQYLGADNIQLREGTDGRLKITYYSDSDVESIKKEFSKEHAVNVRFTGHGHDKESTEFPSDNNSNSYNLDVYEIQDDSDVDWDLEGISVIELKSENHRFFNPNIYVSVQGIDDIESTVKVAYKVHAHIATAIDNISSKIPEVRAGPFSFGNS